MKDRKKPTATKVSLVLRLVIAVYLLYLAWDLRTAPATAEGVEKLLFTGAIVVFAAVAVVLGAVSLKALLRGEYDQPEDEPDEDEEQPAAEESDE